MRTLASSFALPILAFAAALAHPALAQSTAAPGDTAASLPSVALPPELDRVLRDYERAWRASDAAAVAALFTSDGFVLQNGRPPARGRAAIEAAYAGQGGPLHLRGLAYATSDAVAYIIGAYGYARAGAPAGSPVPDIGKFTLTLRRAPDGRWLIFSDMDNASRRPPRPSPAPASATPPGQGP